MKAHQPLPQTKALLVATGGTLLAGVLGAIALRFSPLQVKDAVDVGSIRQAFDLAEQQRVCGRAACSKLSYGTA